MRKTNLSGRIVIASVAFCLAASLAVPAQASILYSGPINQTIQVGYTAPRTYIDLDTGTIANTSFAGHDIEFYNGLGSSVSGVTGANTQWIGSGAFVTKVPMGSIIGPSSSFIAGAVMGTWYTPRPFALNTDNYAGFSHVTTGGTTVYGWMNLRVGASMADTTIVDYAYETSGSSIAAGAIPEPTTAALLLIGTLGILRRRNR